MPLLVGIFTSAILITAFPFWFTNLLGAVIGLGGSLESIFLPVSPFIGPHCACQGDKCNKVRREPRHAGPQMSKEEIVWGISHFNGPWTTSYTILTCSPARQARSSARRLCYFWLFGSARQTCSWRHQPSSSNHASWHPVSSWRHLTFGNPHCRLSHFLHVSCVRRQCLLAGGLEDSSVPETWQGLQTYMGAIPTWFSGPHWII